MTRSRVF